MGMGRCGDKRKTETPVKRVWMAGRRRMAHGLCPCFLVVYDATCMPLCKPTVAAYCVDASSFGIASAVELLMR